LLPITTLITASLQDIEYIVIAGHPAHFFTLLLALSACNTGHVSLFQLLLSSWCQQIELLSLIRSTQSLSHIPLCRVCIVSNYKAAVKSRKRHCV